MGRNNGTGRFREDALGSYWVEVRKILKISPEEEIELIKRIKTGDEPATQELISVYLRVVVYVAEKYKHVRLPFKDLVAEGNFALIKATRESPRKLDENPNFEFFPYAVSCVRGSILNVIVASFSTELSREDWGKNLKLQKVFNRLSHELGRNPAPEELAEKLGISVEEVDRMFRADNQEDLSLDQPVKNTDDMELRDFVAGVDGEEVQSDLFRELVIKESLRAMLSRLTPTEREVVQLTYGENLDSPGKLTWDEVSEITGLTMHQVRHIENKTIRRIRSSEEFADIRQKLGLQ